VKSLIDYVVETAVRGGWAQANRELAMEIARDYATLYMRALAGEKVSRELGVVRASILQLGSAAASTGMAAIENAIWRAVGRAVATVMA
jgi:hypothetical protein